jgi:hypothetical protein
MLEPNCNNCKIGTQHLINHNLRKQKILTYREVMARETKLGKRCFLCSYNGIKGKKSYIFKKTSNNFQSIDLFVSKDSNIKVEEIEGM